MKKHLPSLSALRAFEATARHLSFTRAAVELHLTQTAISHRIKELESLLAVQLFTRGQNTITLTEEGRNYLELVRPAIAQIAIATENISGARENQLHIACLNAFAVKCLLPMLPQFRLRHPEIAVRITPATVSERQAPQDFDVAIWHGVGDWPELHIEQLGREEIFPVCSPRLVEAKLRDPEDLRHQVVIRTVSPIIPDEWPAWMEHAGLTSVTFAHEIQCTGLFFSLEAAISGLGLSMGRSQLVAQDIASARLVEPFSIRLATETAYYLVSRPDRTDMPKVAKFRSWLTERMNAPASGHEQISLAPKHPRL